MTRLAPTDHWPLTTDHCVLRLPQFEGPLDLLLQLIERRELAVTAISLAAVADQFLAHLGALADAGAGADALADFVAVGARLVLIKSQALLPRPARSPEADDEVDDAEALARQLAEYRQARATALGLAERQQAGARAHARSPRPPPARSAPPLAPVGLDDLVRAVRRRLLDLPAEPVAVPAERVVTLAEKMTEVEALLAGAGRLRLSDLLWRATSRSEVIVMFISLLELVRRRRITVQQRVLFGDIDIEVMSDEHEQ